MVHGKVPYNFQLISNTEGSEHNVQHMAAMSIRSFHTTAETPGSRPRMSCTPGWLLWPGPEVQVAVAVQNFTTTLGSLGASMGGAASSKQ